MNPPLPPALTYTFVTVVGAVVGSFLNVVIARVPAGLSIVTPPSRCPKCERPIRWYENVPVLSWIALGARCRGCHQRISVRYPLVELLTALLFVASLSRFGLGWELAAAVVLCSFLVALTFIDLDTWLLPDPVTLPGIAAGLLLAMPRGWTALRDGAIGAVAGFLVFWAMEWVGERLFKKEALGGGDKYLLALIGAFLGWKPLLVVIFLASLQGAIVGIVLLLVRGRAGPDLPQGGAAATTPPGRRVDSPAVAPPSSSGTAQAAASPETATGTAAGAPLGSQEAGDQDDWVPGPTNMPFGPWLAIAALEVLLASPWLVQWLPSPLNYLLLP